MRKTIVAAVTLALTAGACMGGGTGQERTVFVDFSHDEFNSFFLFNFPKKVTVRQGTTVVFRQTWTGEPHTVTGGTRVTEKLEAGQNWIRFFEAFDGLAGAGVPLPDPENPGDAAFADVAEAIEGAEDAELRKQFLAAYEGLIEQGTPLPNLEDPPDISFVDFVNLVEEESEKAFEGLPSAFDEDEEGKGFVTQNAGQPCYLSKGGPPEDQGKACTDAQQEQPVFDGTHSYYNSGIIPFEGQQGNTYRVALSEDLEPGTYWFYCAVHGFGQSTELEVKPDDADVPSPAEVTRQARREINEIAEPLEKQYREAVSEGVVEVEGARIEGPFAGLPGVGRAAIDEFIPKRRTVNAGEPITWKMMGADHTISFDVPEYFPVVEFAEDGTVRLNPKLQPSAGGASEPAEPEGEGVFEVDGGSYDGEGFWSSGLLGAQPYVEYTLRITEPGSYRYACLIHPPMVGTVVVTA